MSKFSDCLTALKESRGLTVTQISKISQQDKTTLFRWFAGNELPNSWQPIASISESLQLSMEEEQNLRNAYQLTKMGEQAYACHYKIMEILQVLQQRGTEYYSLQKGRMPEGVCLPGFVQMGNKLEIIQWTQKALGYLAMQKEKRLYLKMQTHHPEIQMLLKIFFGCTENGQIEEIVCLENEAQGSALHNLEVLKGIAEILVQKHPVEVFWQEALEREKGFLDNWILSDSFMLQFDGLLSKGMLVTEPEWLSFFHCAYQRMKASSQSLGGKECGLPELFGRYGRSEISMNSLEYMPCIGPCLTLDVIEKQVNRDIPKREALIQEIYASCAGMGIRGKAFFCREGLTEFMETGRIESFPYEIYQQADTLTCCQVIERAIALTEQGMITYRMVKEEQFPNMKGLYVEQIEGESGLLSIDMHFAPGTKERFSIKDKGIQKHFQEFFQNLEDSYAYSTQETVEYLKKTVAKYREKALKREMSQKV